MNIAYSWKCNARCAHCSVDAGPEHRRTLDPGLVLQCIDDAASLGLDHLEITGGEVFLFYHDLLGFLRHASELGMRTAVDTNGFWAKSPGTALARLRPLKESGLGRLLLSTDSYHRRYIPLERVLFALDTARELDLDASVTVCSQAGDSEVLETLSVLRRHGAAIDLQPVAPVGRGTDLPETTLPRCSFEAAGAPCSALTAPTVGPDLRVSLCCAPPVRLPLPVARETPLVLGWLDRQPLATILRRAQSDPLLGFLSRSGARGLAERLGSASPGGFEPRAGGYFGKCDLCLDLLTDPGRVEQLRAQLPGSGEEKVSVRVPGGGP